MASEVVASEVVVKVPLQLDSRAFCLHRGGQLDNSKRNAAARSKAQNEALEAAGIERIYLTHSPFHETL